MEKPEEGTLTAPVPTYAWSDLADAHQIAKGTTTAIYRGVLHGLPIAAKLLAPERTLSPGAARKTAAFDLRSEAAINARLRHPHIVQFLGLVTGPAGDPDPPGLLFELAEGGNLNCTKFGPGRLGEGLDVCLAVARALAHVHALGVLHRDIKPSQVLFCAGGVPKLGDWGLSRGYNEGDECTGETGTSEYMAPEVIRAEQYDFAADVYSFGMVLHGVACGLEYPYAENYLTAAQAAMGVARNDLRPKISSHVDKCVQEIITKCWRSQPKDRPKMREVINMLLNAKEVLKKQKDSAGMMGAVYNYFYG